MADIFRYFDNAEFDNRPLIDIWKDIDLSEQIEGSNFQYYIFKQHDNLMDISYRFYNTIDDWWIIYLYNTMYDINFDLLDDNVIIETIDGYIENIANYDSLLAMDKLRVTEVIREYYIAQGETLEQAIIKANELLANESMRTDSDFVLLFKDYLNFRLIEESFIQKQIMVPSDAVVFDIKNRLEELSKEWKNNNEQ